MPASDSSTSATETATPSSLYVHVPWCRSKCRYCAFYSIAEAGEGDEDSKRATAKGADGAAFAAACAAEIRARAPEGFAPAAMYVGGGTPSILGAGGVSALCRALRGAVDLSAVREWTFEANPDSATAAVLDAMLAGGATRLSLGAQSFDDATLRFLGRPHDAAAIRRAVAGARAAGFGSIGLDLIAGIPGLSPESWRRSLDEALALAPDHVSVYALTVESGTPLAEDVAAGRVRMPPDDAVMDALAEAERVLGAAGLARYEISNYAQPGRECLYNLSVWRGEDYLGIGPSASSRLGLERRTNAADTAAWLATGQGTDAPCSAAGAFAGQGTDSPCSAAGAFAGQGTDSPAAPRPLHGAARERLSPREDRLERFLTGLRLAEGADPARAAPEDAARMEPEFRRLAMQGFVESVPNVAADAPTRWRLTARGREVADAVALELV